MPRKRSNNNGNGKHNGNGRLKKRDEMVLAVLPKIRKMAGRVWNTISHANAFDMEDMVQDAVLGLLEWRQLLDYDPKRAGLPSYVFARIRGAIYDGIRNMSWAGRGVRARLKRENIEEAKLISLDQSFKQDGSRDKAIEFTDSQSPDPVKVAIENDMREIVQAVLDTLPDNLRHVLYQNTYGGKYLNGINKGMGVCPSRVSQLRIRGYERIKPRLVSRGMA